MRRSMPGWLRCVQGGVRAVAEPQVAAVAGHKVWVSADTAPHLCKVASGSLLTGLQSLLVVCCCCSGLPVAAVVVVAMFWW